QAGAVWIRMQSPVHGFQNVLEDHSLDSNMIVKVFQMTSGRNCTAHVSMNRGSRMGRRRKVIRVCQGGRLEKSTDSCASGCIGLQYINSAPLQHPPEIRRIVAVLSCGDVHSCRCPVTNQTQTIEVIGRHWFLEPLDVIGSKVVGEIKSLLACIG